MKFEKEIEAKKRLIGILDERAGPATVDSGSSDSDTKSVPGVEHEVEQRDQFFAKSFTFTTNVSNQFFLYFRMYECVNLCVQNKLN